MDTSILTSDTNSSHHESNLLPNGTVLNIFDNKRESLDTDPLSNSMRLNQPMINDSSLYSSPSLPNESSLYMPTSTSTGRELSCGSDHWSSFRSPYLSNSQFYEPNSLLLNNRMSENRLDLPSSSHQLSPTNPDFNLPYSSYCSVQPYYMNQPYYSSQPYFPPQQVYPPPYTYDSYPHSHSRMSARTEGFIPHSKTTTSDDSNIIHIEKVKSGEDKRTTLMIRNIPNGFNRKTFVKIINHYCKNCYDFLYLPFDEKTNCNMGYGYVNMIDLKSVETLYNNFNNHRWPHTKSEKICNVCYGRLQSNNLEGSESLLQYCSDWSVMTSDEMYHPLFFKKVVEKVGNEDVIKMVRCKPEIDYNMRAK